MSDLDQALHQVRAALPGYQRYTRYYDGQHPLAFATEKFRNAFGAYLRELAYNLCAMVIDTISDRLEVTGFGVQQGNEAAAADAWAIWQRNHMDLRAGQVHQEALRCGDAYVIVWNPPDKQYAIRNTQYPILYPQRADRITTVYDDEQPDLLLWAAKVWVEHSGGKRRPRATLYYPDRIERYAGREGDSTALPDTAKGMALLADGGAVPNPYNIVPVFHFANDGAPGSPGKSELKNLTAMQDALNKELCDLMVASEFVAYPQRWATGLEVDIDPDTGKPRLPFTPGVERIWSVSSEGVKFGEFPQADLAKPLAVIADLELKIARLAGIPPHYLALITDPPSGAALKTLEARFVKKCRDRATSFGTTWELAMQFALTIAASETSALSDQSGAQLSCKWADPAPMTETELVDVGLKKLQAGASRQQVLKELGYGEREIETMLAQNHAEAALAVPSLTNPFGA